MSYNSKVYLSTENYKTTKNLPPGLRNQALQAAAEPCRTIVKSVYCANGTRTRLESQLATRRSRTSHCDHGNRSPLIFSDPSTSRPSKKKVLGPGCGERLPRGDVLDPLVLRPMDYRRPFYRIETLVSRPILKNIIMRAGGSISLLDSDERPEVDIVAFGQRYSREQNVYVYRDKCWEEAFTDRVSAE
jgi:hypothetical protein